MRKSEISLAVYIALAALVIAAIGKWRAANPQQVIAVAEVFVCFLFSGLVLGGVIYKVRKVFRK